MRMLGQRSMTRRTRAAGTWAGGVFTPGAAADSDLLGTWRPAPQRTLQRLAEGDRARDPRVLYTRTQLQTTQQGEDLLGDLVSPDGTTWYEVGDDYDGSSDTAQHAPQVNHRRYLCLRVQEAE